MTIEHLMYQHDGITFGCLVDADNLENYRDGNMTAAEVLDVFEVFKFASGKQGNIIHFSIRLLAERSFNYCLSSLFYV
jgi:hypothetical protein